MGKNGLSEEFMVQIDELLEKRELIKVHLLQNTDEETDEAAAAIAEAVDAFVVQTIGRVITLYRQSSEVKNQKVSTEVRALA
ncbi:MAG: RNA-binding protein [Aerococcus viridans]|nr:MAG: RNA-binding protein [Aerococcus viridans]